ncbi:MAG: PilW family protein [Thiobacillus sp.]
MKNISPIKYARGLSLIELMIAVALGGLVLAAVGGVYLSSSRTFKTQEGMARMQEGARFAFEIIGFDLRQVGFGCASISPAAVSATWHENIFTRSMQGYKDGSGSPAAAVDVANTDAIMVLRADKSREVSITALGTTSANHGMAVGGKVVITDAYANASSYSLAAAAGTGYTLGAATDCTGANVPNTVGFRMLPLAANVYYIGNNPAGEPSLYRQALQNDGTVVSEELVEGVEDMVVFYGEDTTQVALPECPDDGCTANAYFDADGVTNWNRVVSARITLTMRSANGLASDGGRLRRTFTTTIAYRNRL